MDRTGEGDLPVTPPGIRGRRLEAAGGRVANTRAMQSPVLGQGGAPSSMVPDPRRCLGNANSSPFSSPYTVHKRFVALALDPQ